MWFLSVSLSFDCAAGFRVYDYVILYFYCVGSLSYVRLFGPFYCHIQYYVWYLLVVLIIFLRFSIYSKALWMQYKSINKEHEWYKTLIHAVCCPGSHCGAGGDQGGDGEAQTRAAGRGIHGVLRRLVSKETAERFNLNNGFITASSLQV